MSREDWLTRNMTAREKAGFYREQRERDELELARERDEAAEREAERAMSEDTFTP